METIFLISPHDFGRCSYASFILVADIGGTTTTLALMGARGLKAFDIIFKHIYPTREIGQFEDVLNNALKQAKELYDIETSLSCLSAAGPLEREGSYIKLTNSDKEIDTRKIIGHTLLGKIILLNDFEAVSYGLGVIDINNDTICLTPGISRQPDGTLAAIGAGTGLGVSIAPFDKESHSHKPILSEGGHIDFPPTNELETELLWFIRKNAKNPKNHSPCFEDVLSGRGLDNIYNFLSTKYQPTPISKIIDRYAGAERLDKIVQSYHKDGRCKKTVDLFVRFYARAAKELALMSCCRGGLFITGRLALKYQEHLRSKEFLEEFTHHDGMTFLLRQIPLYLVTNPDIALYGCASVALN